MAGGMELALWCDCRVLAEDAYFGVYCRRWGIPLLDGGADGTSGLTADERFFALGHRLTAEEWARIQHEGHPWPETSTP